MPTTEQWVNEQQTDWKRQYEKSAKINLCSDKSYAGNVPCNENHVNEISGIPPGRLLEMQMYAIKLKKKFPHMKAERIAKKVADYFHVRLTYP